MPESLLRQAFVADCVSDGCNIETAEQYASLFNGWHIGTMGYGVVLSRSFENEQFHCKNQGLRRMFLSKRIDLAAHSVELNAPVPRGSLSGVLAIYDGPSTTMIDKCRRMALVLARGAGMFKPPADGVSSTGRLPRVWCCRPFGHCRQLD